MSVWTHVAGSVRIDAFMEYFQTLKEVEDILGKPTSYEDTIQEWDRCKLPMGSEGSIQYRIIQSGMQETNKEGNITSSDAAAFVVNFWGDLRDFETKDVKKIETWWSDLLLNHDLMIRQAVLLVETEGGNPRVFIHKDHPSYDPKQAKIIEMLLP